MSADDSTMAKTHEPSDRWKCPDCGIIIVDPGVVLAACVCGSERIQMREWPRDEWEAPDWPEDSDYSPDPHDVETDIEYKNTKRGGRE